MALKAGTVGVNPDILDSSGRVKEIPAGEHDLSFEVDKATGKAGYKIDDGDFHPFEEAGVTVYGWVKPANLVRTGLNIASGCTVDDGGYAEIDGQIVIDVTFHCNAQMTTPIGAWPAPDIASGTVNVPSKESTDASVVDDYTPTYYMQITTSGNIYTTAVEANKYYHLFGTYKKKTT